MKQAIRKAIKEAHNIEEKEIQYTLLIDGNSVMKRSFSNDKVNVEGKEYGMVLQSLKFIKDVITIRDFSHCYFFMDGHGSGQLRADFYEAYKANRGKKYRINETSEYYKKLDEFRNYVLARSKEKQRQRKKVMGETEEESFERQRDILCSILDNLFVRRLSFDDVEGDDLIAYYVKNRKENEKIVIISGDRDITQLINDDVAVYILDLRSFVSSKNAQKVLGIPSQNVVLQKIICGDDSDNIKGIKGAGETTLQRLFPDILTRPMTIDEIITQANQINEERAKEKKKPLLVCTNIVNRVTDGIQGDKIYDINKRLIDLSEPLLTEEAKEEMDLYMDSPLDPTDREYKYIIEICKDNKITEMMNAEKFGDLFGCFEGLIKNEKKFFNEN